MTDLLPCPFCGGEARLFCDDLINGVPVDAPDWVIECEGDCTCRFSMADQDRSTLIAGWNRRALPAVTPQCVKVKPLEWGPYPNVALAGPDIAVANFDLLGAKTYQVQRDPWGSGFLAFTFGGAEFFHWESKGHATLEAAKAAAQANYEAYEARILSALGVTPAAPVTLAAALALPEIKALAEAASALADEAHRNMRGGKGHLIDEVVFALRRIAEARHD